MSSKTAILIEFKKSLVEFFDQLVEQFPDEGDLIMVRIFIKDQVPIEDVIEGGTVGVSLDSPVLKTARCLGIYCGELPKIKTN